VICCKTIIEIARYHFECVGERYLRRGQEKQLSSDFILQEFFNRMLQQISHFSAEGFAVLDFLVEYIQSYPDFLFAVLEVLNQAINTVEWSRDLERFYMFILNSIPEPQIDPSQQSIFIKKYDDRYNINYS
jgi:hypothetical protein